MKKILSIVGVFILLFAIGSTTFSLFYSEQKKNRMIFAENSSETQESRLYNELVKELGDDYFIENVNSTYVSEEYVEDLEYNSKKNIYFGYTSEELDKEFGGKKYVFTYDKKVNSTKVKEFEKYDDTYDKALKNVAVGSGVIITCITVSSLTAGTAPAISVILMTAAKTGAVSALSTGTMSALTAGVIEAVKTNDSAKALKAAASEGSEGFKWGAIAGSVGGGFSKFKVLKGATLKGLTMNEAAIIQKKTNWPLEVIKNISSMDEYKLYEAAGLKVQVINGRIILAQPIDLTIKSKLGGKTVTNLERILKGASPVDKTGTPFELHHIGQSTNSPLAILTREQHRLGENNKILHNSKIEKGVHKSLEDNKWKSEKKTIWKAIGEIYKGSV